MSQEVVLAGAVRTAIGRLGGALAGVSAAELGAVVIKEALARAGVAPSQVDEVYLGCVLQAGLGQNVARQASIGAGVPVAVPALTVNNVCGSGLKCVNMAAAAIACGDAEIVVAGGTESMSNAPYVNAGSRFGLRMGNSQLVDSMVNDGLWDRFGDYHMGVTAENVARQFHITREMQDAFAARSQQRCEAAQARGRFRDEIVPVGIASKKATTLVEVDEHPRSGVTPEELAKLNPSFEPDGTVTPANASGINDGAAALVVMSAKKAEQLGVRPMARFVAGAWAGVDPSVMGIGPVYSTRKALDKAGLSLEDIDLIEANEAFAAQALAVGQELGWDDERVNVNGGAIALGHPIGASGARILVTLLHELEKRRGKYGLATLCVGGGMGVSTILERL